MGLKSLLLCVLVATIAAQFSDVWFNIRDRLRMDNTVDTFHGWRLEDHHDGADHILLFINDQPDERYCYVIRVSHRWEPGLQNQTMIEMMTEEIFAMIKDPNHRERPINTTQLFTMFHDFEASRECTGHDTYLVRFRPSWA